jgi:hypothetical protein
MGPTQAFNHWALSAISKEVKQQGREADRSPQSSPEVKKGGAITLLPDNPSLHSA